MFGRQWVGGVVLATGIALAAPTSALATPPVGTTMTIKVVPTSITIGQTATVTATVTPDTGEINCGKGQIQYQINGGAFLQLANNLDVVSNEFQAVFDTNNLPNGSTVAVGDTVTFRAGFEPSGGCGYSSIGPGQSPTTDLHIVGENGGFCPDNQTTGVFIAITGPNGNGLVPPGSITDWTFDVTVTACEDVFDVSAQGGANGWAPFQSFVQDAGNPAGDDTGDHTVKTTTLNKNTILLWQIGDLVAGQSAKLTVDVKGTIKNNVSECGKVKLLNGAWSALYAEQEDGPKTKSAYTTYTATITVGGGICP